MFFVHVYPYLYFSSFSSFPYALAAAMPPRGLCSCLSALMFFSTIDPLKQHIASTRPYVWVVNETKSFIPVASRVFVPGYQCLNLLHLLLRATLNGVLLLLFDMVCIVRPRLHLLVLSACPCPTNPQHGTCRICGHFVAGLTFSCGRWSFHH
jgi:hypothetical protein